MKASLAVPLLLASSIHALPELSIARSSHRGARLAHVKRQDDRLESSVFQQLEYSAGGAYFANITVGTPPQAQVILVSTGSSDLYLDAPYSAACSDDKCLGGTFDSGNSDTYKVVEPAPAFNTSYGDGSTASGPFATDIVCMSDVCITNVQFGVAEHIESTTGPAFGILGIGYSANEANSLNYPNFVDILVQSGQIDGRLYSLYLNDIGNGTGSILFGGIDASKYTGSMQTFNLLPNINSNNVTQFLVAVTDLSVTIDGTDSQIFADGLTGVEAYGDTNTSSRVILLESSSAAWSVPSDVYATILSAFSFVDSNGYCSCTNVSAEDSMTLTFGDESSSIDIEVPATEFIVPVFNSSTLEPYSYGDGTDACMFMISNGSSSSYYTMGDAMLRSMYVVFDLDNGQVSIAQANVNSTSDPDIRDVQVGSGGVAEAVAANQPSASQSYSIPPVPAASASYSVSTATTSIGAITALPTPAAPKPTGRGGGGGGGGGSGLSTGAKAGIGVGVSVAALAAIVLLVWFLLRRKRKVVNHRDPSPARAELESPSMQHRGEWSTGGAEKKGGSIDQRADAKIGQDGQKYELQSEWRGHELS